jgi:4-aminobutyrate aminotransferase
MVFDSFIEGDINLSEERLKWAKEISHSSTKKILEKDERYFLHQALSTPCLDVLSSSNDSSIITLSGKKMFDFHGNSVHQLGYNNKYVLEKVIKQLNLLPFSPRRYTNEPAVALAEKLASLLPGDLNRSLFAPGGTLAIGMSMKLARLMTGNHRLVSMIDSFHGASIDAISAGGEEQFRRHMEPLLPGIIHISPPPSSTGSNAASEEVQLAYALRLEEIIEKEGGVGAFLSETIRNTDVQIPSIIYWKKIREICDRHGVLLILDEIPSALGRTGRMFAFEHYDIEPDILCLGKGFGAGLFPFAAMVTRDKFKETGSISLGHYTHEKSPIGCVAALSVIEFIQKENLLQKVNNDALWLENELGMLKLRFPVIGDVRGIGMLWAIELIKDSGQEGRLDTLAEKIMYNCMRRGLSFKVSKGNILQLSPPLTVTRGELSDALSILADAFAESC